MKRWLIIVFCILLQSSLFCEKWVGQVATYQLGEGEKTASGEIFAADGFSAACNGFRLGATVEVINIANGKSVKVKINDRLSSESKYFILLSPEASKQIDLAWETGPVVVSADFSAVNSTDILPVNGLLSEGTYDEEKVRNFPTINWPDETADVVDVTSDTLIPEAEVAEENTEDATEDVVNSGVADVTSDVVIPEAEIVEEKIEDATDDIVEDVEKDAFPAPLETTKSVEKMGAEENKAIAKVSDTTPKHIKPVEVVHEKKATAQTADIEDKPEVEPVEEVLPEVAEEPVYVEDKPQIIADTKNEKPEAIFEDIKTIEPKKVISDETFDKIKWTLRLDDGKVYIKFFTSSKQDDFASKYFNYNKLFGKVLAFRKGNLYHLITGPVNDDKIDATVNGIRNFGFRDAYIIKGGVW